MSATSRDLMVALLTAGSIALARPPAEQPEPKVETIERPQPSPTGTARRKTGVASWYDYVRGGAAAGPALRTLLGKHWRGQQVKVCTADHCVEVTLSDWCQCYWKQPRERLIDLDVASFAKLAPTSQGVIKVTVSQ